MRLYALLLCAALVTACSDVTGPEIPAGAVRFEPPARYAEWWTFVQNDAGIAASMDRVRWFMVPGGPFTSSRDNTTSAGRWISDGRIYIAERHIYDKPTIMHEMLHELLRGDRDHEHPLFRTATYGGYVPPF